MKKISIIISDTFKNKMMKANVEKTRVRMFQSALLLALSMILPGSCKDFLTENLKGSFSTDTFYQNDKQALQAIAGTYNALSFSSADNVIWVLEMSLLTMP